MPDALLIVFVIATFLLAGLIKGVIGLGLPTVAVALLGLALPPAQAAALLVVPSLVTNVWQFAVGGRIAPLLRRLWPMLAGIGAGTWAGSGLIAGGNGRTMSAVLGLTLIVYAVVSLVAPRLRVPPRAEAFLSPAMGAATGLVTAATGVLVIPAVPYLQALKLERDDLVQAMGLSFTASTLALAVSLAGEGLFAAPLASASALALLPALLGMWLGGNLRKRIRPDRFRLYLFAALLAVGAHLALRPLL
jgi:uncharacterized membrane protein YfcA